jgi:hypothetical protein
MTDDRIDIEHDDIDMGNLITLALYASETAREYDAQNAEAADAHQKFRSEMKRRVANFAAAVGPAGYCPNPKP